MNSVAIYARVSSERQAQQATIQSQISELEERARTDGHAVLPGDIYADDGVSGATLVRPALERLRDRVAEGSIDILYIHSPDRLARRHAYQVLLLEELLAHRVAVVFVHGPSGNSPEDALLAQFQGIFAEYERARILERCRRGRIYRARQGAVSVLAGAPYGYRYVRRLDSEPARYDVLLPQAKVVRRIFDALVHEQKSLYAIARMLSDEHIPTARGGARWDRSTVARILHNPAYAGQAAFGRFESVEPGARLRPARGRNAIASRSKSSQRKRSEEEWIRVHVPALVSTEVFAAAQEQMAKNRRLSPRNAHPRRYLLQGLLVCACCQRAFCGCFSSAVRKGKRFEYVFYRCTGTLRGDARTCHNLPVRADLLDGHVWESVREILQSPRRVMNEWARRASTEGEPAERRRLRDEAAAILARHEGALTRLLDAYEAGAIELPELTQRSARLQTLLAAARRELEVAEGQLGEALSLRAVTARLEDFAARVQHGLDALDWNERQRLIRLLVNRIEITEEGATIVYRIPGTGPVGDAGRSPPNAPRDEQANPTVSGAPSPNARLRSRVAGPVSLATGHRSARSRSPRSEIAPVRGLGLLSGGPKGD
jgi:site-specific DNA recombinase